MLVIRTSVPDLEAVLYMVFCLDQKSHSLFAGFCDIIMDLHTFCLGTIQLGFGLA